MTRRVELEIYDQALPLIKQTTLVTDSDYAWEEVLNDVGSGEVTIDAEDGEATFLDCRNYVRCVLDGVDRFTWVVESRNRKTLPADGKPSSKVLTVSGRGVLSLMEQAIVFPELGTDRLSPDTRIFNFASADYVEGAAWISALEIKKQDATGDWDGAPLDWPDPDAYWIWATAKNVGGTPPQAVGKCYFRKSFTLVNQTLIRLFFTGDDGIDVYVDDQLIFQTTRAFMWAEANIQDVLLDPGTHIIAVTGTNIVRENVASNVAGVILTGVELTDGGTNYGSVVVRTDSSWSALAYPLVAPTMTPGEIMIALIWEAWNRIVLTQVIYDFTASHDSSGNVWSIPVDVQFSVGTTYLQVLRTLMETAVDVRMGADLIFHMYNKGTLGSDKTATVSLNEGEHLSDFEHASVCPVTNSVLTKLQTGEGTNNVITGSSWSGSADAASIAGNGKLEAYVELGTAPSSDQADRTMIAVFDEHSVEQVTASFQAEERTAAGAFLADERPIVGWDIGDIVLAPGVDDLPTDTTIVSIHVSNDPSGGPDPIFKVDGTQTPIAGS